MQRWKTGFTLIELLIVIAIVAVLAVTVILTLNPAQLLTQARDSTRLTDLTTLHKTLALLGTEAPVYLGSSSTVYVSLPDSSSTCSNLNLPALPSGYAYACATANALRNIDGTGWLPVNFTALSAGSPLAALPIDPVNSAVQGRYYTFVSDGHSWELTGLLNAKKHRYGGEQDLVSRDGGNQQGMFEIGTNLALNPLSDDGLLIHWKFDEGTGTVAQDMSGSGNDATLTNGPVWLTGGNCVSGNCVALDGVNDYVIRNPVTSFPSTDITTTFWAKSTDSGDGLISYASGAYDNHLLLFSSNSLSIHRDGPSASTGVVINDGSWHFIALTWTTTGGVVRLYKDGALEYSGSLSAGQVLNNSGAFLLGQDQDSLAGGFQVSQAFGGTMDDVRVYSRVLSAAEVANIYNTTL